MAPIWRTAIVAVLVAGCGGGGSGGNPGGSGSHGGGGGGGGSGGGSGSGSHRVAKAVRPVALVTDDARGTLTAIRLRDLRVVGTFRVGARAHHMTSNPDGRRLWIALGEHARTLVIVDTTRPARLRLIGRFRTRFAAHDLAFSPDGRRVWISSADGPDVSVLRASDHRTQLRVAVGRPPQHIAFAGSDAYLTSGYGSTLERVSARTGRLIRRARSPYGSFEVAAADGYVTTTSLLTGELAIYTPRLQRLHVVKRCPAARDVDITNR